MEALGNKFMILCKIFSVQQYNINIFNVYVIQKVVDYRSFKLSSSAFLKNSFDLLTEKNFLSRNVQLSSFSSDKEFHLPETKRKKLLNKIITREKEGQDWGDFRLLQPQLYLCQEYGSSELDEIKNRVFFFKWARRFVNLF